MSEDFVGGTPAPETPGGETAPVGTAAAGAEALQHALPLGSAPARYTGRFAIAYTALGVVLAAALTGLVVLVIRPGHHPSPPWSTWKPAISGNSQAMAKQIADHVAHSYKLTSSGQELVAVIPSPPQVTSGTQKISIDAVAVRKAPQSNTGIAIYTSDHAEDFTLCGLGTNCSISQGQPSLIRGQLVRREALELALYTFKYDPSIDSIAAFMPPAPGSSTKEMIYLRKDDLKSQLSQPLSKTLPLGTPPLPTNPDSLEKPMIDTLTLPHLFTYQLTALQTGGAALILDPAT